MPTANRRADELGRRPVLATSLFRSSEVTWTELHHARHCCEADTAAARGPGQSLAQRATSFPSHIIHFIGPWAKTQKPSAFTSVERSRAVERCSRLMYTLSYMVFRSAVDRSWRWDESGVFLLSFFWTNIRLGRLGPETDCVDLSHHHSRSISASRKAATTLLEYREKHRPHRLNKSQRAPRW